jgi:two-component system, NtrC family, sensor kinase
MSSKVSVRQPLVLYATIFMLLFSAFIVTIATQSMITATNRAYRRAIADELGMLASLGSVADVRRAIAKRPIDSEVDIAVVTATQAAFGIDVLDARQLDERPEGSRRVVANRIRVSTIEAYVVGTFGPSIPSAIAYVEIGKLILPVVLGALAFAAMLGWMLRRLLMPSLTALAEIARDPVIRGETLQLAGEDAPNEIFEVAQAFRRTVRQLNEERELIESQHRELEKMHLSLVRASKLASVGRLAAGIAHEIGNPLAAVQGYLAILPRLDDQERADVIERSAKELKRIHETIKKLLAYARKEESLTPPGPIPIAQIVTDAILLVKGHPAMHDVAIDNQLNDSDPPALGNASQLGQVLVNLLLNAAQAMEDQPERAIAIRRREENGAIEIDIEDTGPGIPEDRLEQIFDPFYTTKDPGEGTGLGLAVSRSLVEGMNGDLTVTSAIGKGARFTVRLPKV